MRRYLISLLFLFLVIRPVYASTSSIEDSIQMVYPISGFIPYITSFMVYLLFTVVYLYIIIMYEVNHKKSLILATIVWLCALGALTYFFNNMLTTNVTVALCILSFAIICYKSLDAKAE